MKVKNEVSYIVIFITTKEVLYIAYIVINITITMYNYYN